MRTLATNSEALKVASEELIAFKTAWFKLATNSIEWIANSQHGATDEFLYAPRFNPFRLRIWHHPFNGYLSVQNLEKCPDLDIVELQKALPEGFRIKKHPNSTYLDAPTPPIDMTANFSAEREHVEEGMRIARQALDLVEAAARRHDPAAKPPESL